jgi:hypothetical protein
MKKLFFMLIFAVVAMAVSAQVPYRTPAASEADINQNAETDYIYIPSSGGFTYLQDLVIQVLCTDTYGGTSDGKITIEKSVDGTSWKSMNTTVDTDLSCANDTFTIVGTGVANFRLKTYNYRYRLKAVGTSGDTTLLTTRYIFK